MKQVESSTLLETPHLTIRSLMVPKGGVVPAHAATGQVSVQVLSGTGELRVGERSERLDATRVLVLAPAAEHEVRAAAGADLVLLIQEARVAPCGGMGPGRGRRMGPPPTPAPTNEAPK